MVEVVWTDQAIEQLDQIVAYIDVFDRLAATRLQVRMFDVASSLREFPNRGRPAGNGRRELVTLAPYVLRHRVDGETVFIVAVRHGARRPD